MAKIYISSTYSDLQDIRARAYAQLRKSRHDVISMEDYNPSGRQPLAKCLDDVRNADIYVGIIGWRYGYVPEDDNPDGHSITEREYREAVDAGKEIVAFLTDETAAWPPPLMDSHTGENGAGARINAFRAHVSTVHVRGTFSTAEELAAHLSPAIEEACARLAPVSAAQLDDIANLTREELQNLAARFGIEHPFDTPDPELRRQLTLKADEYRALKAEVDAIDDGLKRLSNLKAGAQDAIARVDLEEVEELLSRVQEVELEEAAKTAELRANNALLRGRVEHAYGLLSAAADSFAAVDPLEPARRRLNSENLLYEHGLRFGGSGIPLSEKMIRDALNSFEREQDAIQWARAQNALAIALTEQGGRTDGAEGADLLNEAVIACSAALEVYSRADHPAQWAASQNNLGNTRQEQGIRIGGTEGAARLAEAVIAYRAALKVCNYADHPMQWAAIQNNLANALQDQGIRTSGADGADLLEAAVIACRAALEVHTRSDHPMDWAMTQNNLGNALKEQGTRSDGAEGANLLAEAVTAYRSALEVRTRADYPVLWATTLNNLGNALQEQGVRTGGPAGAELLAQSDTAYRSALEVHHRVDHPVDWAMTQENISITELARARHEASADPRLHLKAALAAVEGALEVFDPEHMSYNHDKATRLRDEIRAELDKLS